jgi:hypothetical protein
LTFSSGSLILGAKRQYCVSYSLIPSEELKVNTFCKKLTKTEQRRRGSINYGTADGEAAAMMFRKQDGGMPAPLR